MSRTRQLGLFLLLAAAVRAQKQAVDDSPPLDREQKEIIARITESALKYGKDLPDFVCNKVTRRNLDPSGTSQQWRPSGIVNEELNYIGHKGNYKAATVDGKKAAGADSASQPASPDEFGTLLSWIFDPKAQTEFRWNSWTTLNQRRAYVFAYAVKQPNSEFNVTSSKTRIAVAFSGLVWADVETNRVLRVMATGQSPKAFPVQGVTFETTYELTKIGEQEFVLPVKSDFRAKDGKSLIWNEAEFRRYRKPGVD